MTQVLVAKREAEIRLDKQNFGEKREINKRKQMILEGLDPDEVEKDLKKQRERRRKSNKDKVNKISRQIEKRQLQNDVKIKSKKKSKIDG